MWVGDLAPDTACLGDHGRERLIRHLVKHSSGCREQRAVIQSFEPTLYIRSFAVDWEDIRWRRRHAQLIADVGQLVCRGRIKHFCDIITEPQSADTRHVISVAVQTESTNPSSATTASIQRCSASVAWHSWMVQERYQQCSCAASDRLSESSSRDLFLRSLNRLRLGRGLSGRRHEARSPKNAASGAADSLHFDEEI
jgi:hypothetical protein